MRGRACRSVAATAAAGVIIATVLLVMSGSTLPLTTPPAPVVHDSTGGHFTRPGLLPDDHTRTSAPPPNRDGPVPERANVAGWSGDGSVAQMTNPMPNTDESLNHVNVVPLVTGTLLGPCVPLAKMAAPAGRFAPRLA